MLLPQEKTETFYRTVYKSSGERELESITCCHKAG